MTEKTYTIERLNNSKVSILKDGLIFLPFSELNAIECGHHMERIERVVALLNYGVIPV